MEVDDVVLKEVYENLADLGSVLPESFCRMAIRRLRAMGCTVETSDDAWKLSFCIRKAEVEVLDYCHIDLVPSVLYPMLCDRSCGKYLYDRKQTGKLDMEGMDLAGILSSLSEGDVSVSFDAGASDEKRLDALLGLMMESGKGQLSCYRRIRF